MTERHSYIIPGIVAREPFQDIAVKQTTSDPELQWYLHGHRFSDTTCNDTCQLVHKGIVATNVTQMDVANTSPGA